MKYVLFSRHINVPLAGKELSIFCEGGGKAWVEAR